MQTDKEKFVALMAEFGVPLKEEPDDEANQILSIEAKSSPKVIGYTCFCANFKFSRDTGTFIDVGIWE